MIECSSIDTIPWGLIDSSCQQARNPSVEIYEDCSIVIQVEEWRIFLSGRVWNQGIQVQVEIKEKVMRNQR